MPRAFMYDTTKPYKDQILSLIEKTWSTPYVSVHKGVYPIIKKKFSFPEVDHTDGIGTKGVYHWKNKTLKNAVLDALAMNLNDLALMRAVPYKLQNHIVIPLDNHKSILEIVETLSEECKKRNIAMTGGETSIHDTADAVDISITVSGFIENEKQNKFQQGDILIGFQSNGIHSNGFTKVREVFGEEYRTEFTQPTIIYIETILDLDKVFNIHGMMHVTGGAYTKLKDLLENTDIEITSTHQLQPQKIFMELYERGVSDEDMYKTFNCGIGFILSVDKKEAEKIVSRVDGTDIIGCVTSGTGKVKIKSVFSGKTVTL